MTEEQQPQETEPREAPVEEVLGGEVLADAERQAERIRRRGQRSANRILAKAQADAEKAADEILAEARRRAERSSRMVLATVEVETRKSDLAHKEEVITATLEAAWEKLLTRDHYDYGAVLVDLAATAVAQMLGEEFVLQLGDEDAEQAGDAVCRQVQEKVKAEQGREVQVRLSPDHPPIAGGCVVLSADGRLRYDNSFEARRRRLLPVLRRMAAQEVFGMEEPRCDDQ